MFYKHKLCIFWVILVVRSVVDLSCMCILAVLMSVMYVLARSLSVMYVIKLCICYVRFRLGKYGSVMYMLPNGMKCVLYML